MFYTRSVLHQVSLRNFLGGTCIFLNDSEQLLRDFERFWASPQFYMCFLSVLSGIKWILSAIEWILSRIEWILSWIEWILSWLSGFWVELSSLILRVFGEKTYLSKYLRQRQTYQFVRISNIIKLISFRNLGTQWYSWGVPNVSSWHYCNTSMFISFPGFGLSRFE